MQKFLLLAGLIVCAAACRHSGGIYEDRDRWMLSYGMTRMILHGRPRQVTEYVYDAADTNHPEKRGVFYKRYGFSEEGNINSVHAYMNDSLFMSFAYQVNNDGRQERVTTPGLRQDYSNVSRRLSDGSYLTLTHYLGGSVIKASRLRFLSGGDEKILEDYSDSTAAGKPEKTAHFYYQGSRLLRVEAQMGDYSETTRFFYSSFDAPDSLWTYSEAPVKKMIERQLFYHNSRGDVAREVDVKGTDTTRFQDDTYTYDTKGNWVRRVSILRKGAQDGVTGDGRYVIDREFVY